MRSWTLFIALFLLFGINAKGQRTLKSFPIKLSNKLDDYHILGKNSQGIFVHYYGNNDHQIERFNESLRSLSKKSIQFKERNTRLEEVCLLDTGLIVLYSHVENKQQYLKARFLNDRLDMHPRYILLDSIPKYSYQGFEPFYIKQSTNLDWIVSFTIYDDRGIFSVRFHLYDKYLNLIDFGIFEVERRDMVLKSFKVNNQGHLFAVMARMARSSDPHDYTYDEMYTFNYNADRKSILRQDITADGGFRFKQIVSEISNRTNRAYMATAYKNATDSEDLGILLMGTDYAEGGAFLEKHPFTREQMAQLHSYDFKNWVDKAVIIYPKRILPRSDGGCALITEGQYQYTRVIRTPPTNVYFYGESFTRLYDQNHYFDIMGFSYNKIGKKDWEVIMPKIQITEGDGGLFSSFILFESNNLLKFLFNEDIYNNGNFVEYNLNPKGMHKRISLFNSEKDGVTLIPQKGRQISGSQLLIPSEQKRNLQFVLFNY